MIEAFYLDGSVKPCKTGELESISKKFRTWVDITNISDDEADMVEKIFDLHHLTKEDLVNDHVRVKVEEFDNYIFIVMYSIAKNDDVDLSELDFILGENFLITNHKMPLAGFTGMKNNTKKIHDTMSKGMEALMCNLLDYEIDNYFPIMDNFDDKIENIDERIARNPEASVMKDITDMKRKIIEIKKVVHPMREKISFLVKVDYRFISETSVPYFRDIYDHMIHVSDSIEYYREAISNSFEAYMSAVNNKMNETMKMLTIMATVMLPLSLIAGIYGTNFRVLPGAESPMGFFEMILVMVVIASALFLYFRKKRWV